MENKEFLTVRKIAKRNTRNRFILSGIFLLLSVYFYVFVNTTIIGLILEPKKDSIVDPSLFHPGTSGLLFSADIENTYYINSMMNTFAFIFLVLFIYTVIGALSGAADYKKSTTYRQFYKLAGDMEQNEKSIDTEFELYKIKKLPNFPKVKKMDKWSITKRFLKTRFSMNEPK